MVSGKLKVGCTHGQIRLWLLGPGTLKSTLSQLKNKSMNWADYLHAGSDVIIFG